jgi:hypothetical protein
MLAGISEDALNRKRRIEMLQKKKGSIESVLRKSHSNSTGSINAFSLYKSKDLQRMSGQMSRFDHPSTIFPGPKEDGGGLSAPP